jgi:hypothetical protein
MKRYVWQRCHTFDQVARHALIEAGSADKQVDVRRMGGEEYGSLAG